MNKKYHIDYQNRNIEKNITGAGVILLEKYLGKNYVIIAKNNHTKKFDIPGGTIDIGYNAIQTARKELREETNGLFNINEYILNNFLCYNIAVNEKSLNNTNYYDVFANYIKGPNNELFLQYFNNNKKTIENNISKYKLSRHGFFEMNYLCRLSIDQFMNDNGLRTFGELSTIALLNNKEIPIILSKRDTKILKHFISDGVYNTLIHRNPIELNFTEYDTFTKNKYYEQTTCYYK